MQTAKLRNPENIYSLHVRIATHGSGQLTSNFLSNLPRQAIYSAFNLDLDIKFITPTQ